MSIYAWMTMIISVGGVTFLLLWCFYKILTTPDEIEKIHGFEASEMQLVKDGGIQFDDDDQEETAVSTLKTPEEKN